MTVTDDDPRLVFLPVDQATAAYGICKVYRDFWCAVHPEKGILFWQFEGRRKGKVLGASVQGNAYRDIAERVIGPKYPWASVELVPLLLVPIDVGDYTY